MAKKNNTKTIIGAGGKDSGGAKEAKNTLRSRQLATLVDILCEGPIYGLADGLRSIYLDEVPLQNKDGSGMVSTNDVEDDGTYNFVNVAAEWRTGTQNQTPITHASDTEAEVQVSVQVKHDTPIVRTITNPAEGTLDELRVTIGIPQLTNQDTKTGDLNGSEVSFTIEMQNNGGGYYTVVNETIKGKTTSRYQRAYTLALIGTGPWDVRITRLTEDAETSNINNELHFDNYTKIIKAKLSYPNTALAGIRIDSKQFNSVPGRAYHLRGLIIQVPSNYDPDTRTYSGVWDGTFKPAYSNNPAWCFYDILTNARYGIGDLVQHQDIDKWTLYQIGQYCDELVPDGYGKMEPRFTCNLMLQSREEAYSVIQNIASIFRAITFWGAGRILTVQDRPSDPVAIYTNASVEGGAFNYAGTSIKQRHTVALVAWNDPNDFYRQKIEYIQDDEGIKQLGVIQSQVTAFGCTSRGQAHRFGKWMLATEKWATETIGFKTGLDGCVLYPGAIIKTSDRYRAGVRMGGRVVSAVGTALKLDAAIPYEIGKGFTIAIVGTDGSINTRNIVEYDAETLSATLDVAIVPDPQENAVFIVASNEVSNELWRVLGAKEADGGKMVEVSCVAHNPALFDYVDFNTQFELSPISVNTNVKEVPAGPINLSAISSPYIVNNAIVGLKVTLSWTSSAGKYRVTWQKENGTIESITTEENSIDINNIGVGLYTFTVTAISFAGVVSATSYLYHDVNGKSDNPTGLTHFDATGGLFQNSLGWTFTDEIDLDYVEIMASKSVNFDSAIRVAKVGYPSTQWAHSGLSLGESWNYWARVKDTSDNFSDWFTASADTVSDVSAISEKLVVIVDESRLSGDLKARIDLIDADASVPNSVNARVDAAESKSDNALAAFKQLQSAFAVSSTAEADRVNTLVASLENSTTAAIQDEQHARVTADNSLANSISTVQTTLDGHTTSIQQIAQSIDGVEGEYYVRIDANGNVAGFGLANGPTGSLFAVAADKFAIANGASDASPVFIVTTSDTTLEDGTVVPAGTYIKAAYIADASITNAKIGNFIQSNDYVAGQSGWQINKSGLAEFQNAVVRGEIHATTGTFTGTIHAVDGTFSGTLNGATGTFAGELAAGVVDITKVTGVSTRYAPGAYTITVPANYSVMKVTLVGGGGGGGVGVSYTGTQGTGGGGGGGGGCTVATFTGLTPGAQYSLVVGAGGAGAPGGSNTNSSHINGADGVATTITGLATAGGGGGGVKGVSGGAAGTAGTSTSGSPGVAGTKGSGRTGTDSYGTAPGGNGGNAGGGMGTGGLGATASGTSSTDLTTGAGGAGQGYGAGGGGGSGNSLSARDNAEGNGGNGANGTALIEFYNPNGVVLRSEFSTLQDALVRQKIAIV